MPLSIGESHLASSRITDRFIKLDRSLFRKTADQIDNFKVIKNGFISNMKILNFLFVIHFIKIVKKFAFLIWYLARFLALSIYRKPKHIKNEVVLITGSGGYLGRQLVCDFAKQGAHVILWDYNNEENNKTCEYVRSIGYSNCHAYKVDMTNESEVRECAAKVKAKHGFISMIVLAAAIPCEVESIFSMRDSEKLHKTFKLFYESHLWMYQEFVPEMIEKNHGHLVVISSETVFTKLAFTHMYSGMKSAQAKLFECVDSELNYLPDNKVKSTLVYLGGLRKGISTTMVQSLHPNSKYLEKFGLTSEYASKLIMKSVLRNKKYIYLPGYVYLIVFIKYFLPICFSELLFRSRNVINNDNLIVHKHVY